MVLVQQVNNRNTMDPQGQLETDLLMVCNKAITDKVHIGDIFATLCKVRQIHMNLYNYEIYNTAQSALAKRQQSDERDDTKEG